MKATILLSAIAIGCAPAAAWELPPDNGTMGRETIAAILAANDYPDTSGYRQAIDFAHSGSGHPRDGSARAIGWSCRPESPT
jgi:hypothetical protein